MYTAFIPFPRPSFNHMHTHAFKSREPWTLRFPVARTSRPCSLLQRSPFPVARASRPCPSLHRSVFFRHPCERSSIKTSTARAAHPLMGNTHAHRQQVRRPCCTVCSTLASALHARHPRSTDVPPVFLTSASRVRCSPFPVARASRPCLLLILSSAASAWARRPCYECPSTLFSTYRARKTIPSGGVSIKTVLQLFVLWVGKAFDHALRVKASNTTVSPCGVTVVTTTGVRSKRMGTFARNRFFAFSQRTPLINTLVRRVSLFTSCVERCG